eukprot:CAMPEP_0117695968 /NCGR_PEP_ID=MMETSP0804-20121206/28429_1 /TAXON_ID=1074897 /ORGANISM="Tetraselmis astigmatica, Strain CCMP880" /LENGTH=974 /DNA_ID=CAMNT_0005510089 /DNA_START=546 /DNA_END=3468 /DNA_ORIENTATION=+
MGKPSAAAVASSLPADALVAEGQQQTAGEGGAGGEEEPVEDERLGSSCAELLAGSAASCMRAEDKMLALGTQQGTVHLLDYNGNLIREFDCHKAAVNELSFDAKSEYIASCSDDGTVVVHSLYTEESTRLQYARPIKTVALDPNYADRKDRQIACAGLAGQLMLNSRGWLGPRDVVLHKGEGPIQTLRWSGQLIAWGNDKGIKIYDTLVHQRIGYIERQRNGPPPDMYRCSLFWESDALLYIGWGNCVQIARIVQREPPKQGDEPWRAITAPVNSAVGAPAQRYVEIVAFFQTDYVVAGISPFGQDLAILAYITDGDSAAPSGSGGGCGGEAARPELRIVTWDNVEIASDALSLHGFAHYTANDYRLAAFHTGGASLPLGAEPPTAAAPSSRQVTKWWTDGNEPLYYVVSPKDIVLGRPRDGEDRVTWMLKKKRFDEALELVEKGEAAKATTRENVAQSYLEHLLGTSQFHKAAELCPRLLQGNAAAWERWVYMFAQARQLPVLAPFIPVEEPRLRTTAYEVVLSSFLTSTADHPGLLALIRTWPSSGLYSPESICSKAAARMTKYGGSPVLQEVVAELYKIQGKFEEALDMYLTVGRSEVFDFILQHNLIGSASKHVQRLLGIDEEAALVMLVEYWETISPDIVVSSLQAAARKAAKSDQPAVAEQRQHQLHKYLHMLFMREPEAAAAHHGLQVELYAEYDPSALMYFLSHSQQYPLEEAYETCKARGLVKEMVFILGRMGNAPKALSLIINELEDIAQEGVEFVHDQRDDELWDVLITHAIDSPKLTAALLEDIGSYCNPLRLLEKIPHGMAIPGLRDRLVKIISDFRTQTSLREGCNNILQMDCVTLSRRLYSEVRRAVNDVWGYEDGAAAPSRQWYHTRPGEAALEPVSVSVPPAVQRAEVAAATGHQTGKGKGKAAATAVSPEPRVGSHCVILRNKSQEGEEHGGGHSQPRRSPGTAARMPASGRPLLR